MTRPEPVELPTCIRCGQRRRHAQLMHSASDCITALKDALRKAQRSHARPDRV